MATSNLKKNTRIVFPGNTRSIILEIMESNGIKENEEDALKKILQGETTKKGKMAEVIKKTASKEISIKDLPSTLAKNFDLSAEKAKKIAKELEEKVLILSKEITEEEEIEQKTPTEKDEKLSDLENKINNTPTVSSGETKRSDKKDTYREPVE